jgi:hypothetical protein
VSMRLSSGRCGGGGAAGAVNGCVLPCTISREKYCLMSGTEHMADCSLTDRLKELGLKPALH